MHRLIMLLLVITLPACDRLETREAQFSTYEQLTAADEPGNWVPEFLPRSATNIRVRYKVDTGATLLSFRFPTAIDLELSGRCEVADNRTFSLPPPGFLGAGWWPDELVSADTATGFAYEMFRCERNAFLAIDRERGAGFYWRLGPA